MLEVTYVSQCDPTAIGFVAMRRGLLHCPMLDWKGSERFLENRTRMMR